MSSIPSPLFDSAGRSVRLSKPLGEGGEGTVHSLQGDDTLVAKIYHPNRRDSLRERKLQRLLERRFDAALSRKVRIAFPLEILRDRDGAFCGYLMPSVDGIPLKTAYFSRKRIAARFPDLRRQDLAAYALHFVSQVEFLHRHGILIGDINPLNLLVDPDKPRQGWIIDADSFQVDELPCPVGTDIFTPARLQGASFASTLRRPEDEHFSMAIMIFMILMLGKHPYSRIGGEDPARNIRQHAFPYPGLHGKLDQVPPGIWQFIWSHFDRGLKEGFHQVFAEGRILEPREWGERLQRYHYHLRKGYFSDEITPLSYRAKEAVDVTCRDCGRHFQMERKFTEKLARENKQPVCALCRQKIHASILARKSLKGPKELRRKRIQAAVHATLPPATHRRSAPSASRPSPSGSLGGLIKKLLG